MPSPLSSYSVTTDTTFSSTSDADLRQGGINSQLHRGRASFASHVERGRLTNESLSRGSREGDNARGPVPVSPHCSFTTHQHVQRKLKYVKVNTSHTLHSLHSYARDMQRVPRTQTRFRVAIPRVNPGSDTPPGLTHLFTQARAVAVVRWLRAAHFCTPCVRYSFSGHSLSGSHTLSPPPRDFELSVSLN